MKSKTVTFYPSINFFVQAVIILFVFILGFHILHIRNKESIIITLIIFDIYQWFILQVKISETEISGPNVVGLLRISIRRDNAQIEYAHIADRRLKGVYKIYDRNTNKAIHLNIKYLKQDDIKEIARILNLPLPS